LATTQQLLDEARAAKHKLVTGTLTRVFMDQNGERVEYTATNLGALDAYIRQLEAELAGVPRARKPIGFIF
jgi:hypothetical protein